MNDLATTGEELQQIRLAKAQELRNKGINPYTAQTPNRTDILEIRNKFEEKEAAEQDFINRKKEWASSKRSLSKEKIEQLKAEGKSIEEEIGVEPSPPQRDIFAVAGRIRQIRKAGKKLNFIDIVDQSGKIQILLSKATISDSTWEVIQQIDLGDWVWAQGPLGLTPAGELTIFAEKFMLLSKAILPPPQIAEKTHGHAISNAETRQRQRYLDLMMNAESRNRFEIRSKVIAGIRSKLHEEGFLEVETPMMQPLFGGAKARPFVTHHNALHTDLFLRIAPELYLKRLLVGGMQKIYEVNRNFRNEGIDTHHNPEFTMLELYEAFGDYHRMMDITEMIFAAALEAADLPDAIEYQGQTLSFKGPWPRYRWIDLFNEYVEVEWDNREQMEQKAIELGLDKQVLKLENDWLGAELWEHCVEKQLIQPCFVIDFPTAISPLAKQKEDDPRWVERFEVFAEGMELANAFSELNDPVEQQRRFVEQVEKAIELNDNELSREIDWDYIEALQYGMPPAGGLGIGIDRMIMLLTDTPTIRDVILFPQLKPKK